GSVTGGVSDVAIFDPNDLNFTQAAAVDGVNQPYTAVAERDTVTSPSIFIIDFLIEQGQFTWKQSVNGCSSKYDYELVVQLAEQSQNLSTFLESLDAAGCCCGLGLIVRYNSGKIFVAGEKYVNDAAITRFILKNDGSDGDSGKALDDFNGVNLHLKGAYKRPPYEYTGTWDSLAALSDQAGSGS
ncbi:MAG: hypothetical protein ACJ749_12685, partial [Flavisolibacter sp.]